MAKRRKKCRICRKHNRAIWQEESSESVGTGVPEPVTREREDPSLCTVCIASYQKAGEPKTPDAVIKWVATRIWRLKQIFLCRY